MARTRRFRRIRNQDWVDETAVLSAAVEVASVKAQVQAIIRRLRANIDELEQVAAVLPHDEPEEP